jgi:nucleoside phosphorylase
MNLIFFFATPREAAVTIRTFDAVERGEGHYLFLGGEIVISGMGLARAFEAASRASSKQCRWVNIGVAGCLEKMIPIGTAVPIGKTALLQWNPEKNVYHHIPEETLSLDASLSGMVFTSPVPLYFAPAVFEKLALVDMEGHALARVAKEKGVFLSMIKVVSDFCTDMSHATICENLDALSYRLAEEAVQLKTSLTGH